MTLDTDFDAIVVGSGISGGWAAKELTEAGLKVLILERGKPLEHGKDYTGEHTPPWETPFRGKPLRDLYKEEYPIQSTSYAFGERNRHFWNNDKENPYVQNPDKPFLWNRADVVGGRSLLWGRQVYRWSDIDFAANKRDGHGIDWPIRYKDVAPWYSHVEKFIGVTGQAENLPQLPDSEFLPPMEMNAGEKHLKSAVESSFPERNVIMGRAAILTQPHNGRGACHYCGPCHQGCSAGAYFSSQSSTLPAAVKTGNLTLRPNSVVSSLEHDPVSKKISAVNVIDSQTKESMRFTGKLVFLCGSTIGSTQILLNSQSEAYPNGLANQSGALGHYLMDHTNGLGAFGMIPGMMDRYYSGNRPNNIYIPRFRNLDGQDSDANFVRGYGFQGLAMRGNWSLQQKMIPGFGAHLKYALRQPGPWFAALMGFGETLPQYKNSMLLHSSKVDRFGIPQVAFDFEWSENENKMREDVSKQSVAMLKAAGGQFIISGQEIEAPGGAIHEMGTARMGHDPSESVLNAHNQAHNIDNLFVTDGAAMTSSSCVNPSLTYMALTARACDYAVKQLRAGTI
ncbi:MAG: GMC family oxidoreductase [Pseudomonadales bacterium]